MASLGILMEMFSYHIYKEMNGAWNAGPPIILDTGLTHWGWDKMAAILIKTSVMFDP